MVDTEVTENRKDLRMTEEEIHGAEDEIEAVLKAEVDSVDEMTEEAVEVEEVVISEEEEVEISEEEEVEILEEEEAAEEEGTGIKDLEEVEVEDGLMKTEARTETHGAAINNQEAKAADGDRTGLKEKKLLPQDGAATKDQVNHQEDGDQAETIISPLVVAGAEVTIPNNRAAAGVRKPSNHQAEDGEKLNYLQEEVGERRNSISRVKADGDLMTEEDLDGNDSTSFIKIY